MQLQVDHFEKFAGIILQPESRPLTDEEFIALCEQHPDYRVESSAEGDVIIMPPASPRTGRRNARITTQLSVWAQQDARGDVFDSSTCFFLRNGARRSPDSAWIAHDRLQNLPDDDALWRVIPNFIIELKSKSDRVNALRAKMHEWIANGISLGWLIIPETRTVEIYRADGSVEELVAVSEVKGEGPISGFTLPLDSIWA